MLCRYVSNFIVFQGFLIHWITTYIEWKKLFQMSSPQMYGIIDTEEKEKYCENC